MRTVWTAKKQGSEFEEFFLVTPWGTISVFWFYEVTDNLKKYCFVARSILVDLGFFAKAPEGCRVCIGGCLSQRLKGKLKITNRISDQPNAFSFFKLNNLGVLVTQIDSQSFDAETFIFCFPEKQNPCSSA